MNVSNWFAREAWLLDRDEWVVVVSASLAVGLATTTAWATVAATVILLLGPGLLLFIRGRSLMPAEPTAADGALLVLGCFAVLSVTWAADYYWWARAIWPLFGALLAVAAARMVFGALPANWLEHGCRAMLVTYCVILAYSLFEESSGHAIKYVVFWPFQAIGLRDGGLVVDWNHVSKVVAYRTNWNMTVLCFLVWPILLILRLKVSRPDFRVGRLIILIALAATVAQSHHQAAVAALLAGGIAFGAARLNLRLAAIAVAVAWVAAFVVVVPLALKAYDSGLQRSESLPLSFRHRVVFWKATADRVGERPVLGVGAGSSHPLNEAGKATAQEAPGTPFLLETGAHPHNVYLQVIYELGIIGAILMAGAGLFVLFTAVQVGGGYAPYNLAAFATWAVQSAFSFGLFEAWYVFAMALAVCMLVAAQAFWRRRRQGEEAAARGGVRTC